MNFPWNSIQGFSGVSGVGALCLLAIVLLVSAGADELPGILNSFAKTALWSVVAAIPLIAIAYVLGLLSIGFAERFVAWVFDIDSSVAMKYLIAIGSKDTVAVARYQQFWQEHEILAGSSLGFLILGSSGFAQAIVKKGWTKSLIVVSSLTFPMAIAIFILSGWKLQEATHLLQILANSSRGSS
jgi:hypothetical protein